MVLSDMRIRGAIAGGLGGALSWLVIEPVVAPHLDNLNATSLAALLAWDILFGALAGVFIGAALGVTEGITVRSPYRALRGGLIAAVVGLIGGAIGAVIGELVFQLLQSVYFVGRAMAWGVFGAFLGIAEGIIRRSWRGLRSATLGGLVGGALGGIMFDLIGNLAVVTGGGAVNRALGLTLTGAFIGLWIVIVERRLAPALLTIFSGQLEGRQFLLDKARLTLGKDERGDIGVFADPEVQPHHATLLQEGSGYTIQAESGAALAVNSQPTTRQVLNSGDEILVGQTRLRYEVKGRIAPMRSSASSASSAPPADVQQAAPPSYQTPQPAPPQQGYPANPPPYQPTYPQSGPTVPQSPAMSPAGEALWLVHTATGRRYAIQPGVTIGRSPGNSIVLEWPTISGRHAEIRLEGGRTVLVDLGSSNGTFVNNRRITVPNMIKASWSVRLGDEEFVVAS